MVCIRADGPESRDPDAVGGPELSRR